MNTLKMHLFLNKKLIFTAWLCFVPTIVFSQQHSSNSLDEKSNYIWSDLRQTLDESSVIETQRNQTIVEQFSFSYEVLDLLLTQQLFQDHFFAKVQKAEGKEAGITSEDAIKIFQFISQLLNTLRDESPEKIEKFMSAHDFTKADKLISLLILIFQNQSTGKSLDLMGMLGLSVNDSLNLKDIDSVMIDKDKLKEVNDRIAVLSHHLASTGDLDTLNKLLDADYDPRIKTQLRENILHAFIRLNNIRQSNNQLISPYYENALGLLAEHSSQIINERDILGLTALAGAVDVNDLVAFKVLEGKRANLKTRDIFERNIKTIALARDNHELSVYLEDKIPTDKSREKKSTSSAKPYNKKDLIFFNFESFIEMFVTSIAVTNPQLSEEGLKKFYFTMLRNAAVIEELRLELLSKIFYSDKVYNTNTRSIFSAISGRDAQFFKNMTKDQKEHLGAAFSMLNNEGKIYVTHFLLEAIRYSFLPAVEAILPYYKTFDFVRKKVPFNSLDPLSLALFAHASLEEAHPFKSESQKIIRLVAEHIPDQKTYSGFFIELPPIAWATLLGLLEEVKFLHEERKMTLPSYIQSSNGRWGLDILSYTLSRGFVNLHGYLQNKLQPGDCKKAFLN